jgi:hypothetical protein
VIVSRLALTVVAVTLVAQPACKDDPSPIATLTETSPGTEKEAGTTAWATAPIGTKFFRGDAVRTGDGTALLSLGKAALRVQPHSLIRFGEQDGKSSIDVQLGEATLEGSGGTYQLKLGDITLDGQSAVRITANEGGGNKLELVLGAATIEQNGQVTPMATGAAITLGLGDTRIDRPDAAPPPPDAAPVVDAAPPDAAVDAAPAPAPETVAVVITGKNASYVADTPGAKKAKLPAGPSELTGGRVTLGKKTTAKATRGSATLAVPAGGGFVIGGDAGLGLTAGKATASAAADADADGEVGVPGGKLVLKKGGRTAGASIEIKSKRDTKIVVTRGAVDLVGKRTVELQQGETAMIRRDGTIEVREEIPKYFDLRVAAGEKFTVHDPSPSTAIRFTFDCPKGGNVEMTGNGQRRTSTGTDGANLLVPAGSWSYRVKCDGSVKTVKSGKVSVRRDDARRELPPKGTRPTNPVTADGKNYTVVYQNLIPNVQFEWPGGGSGTLHLNKGAKKSTSAVSGGKVVVPGTDLSDGAYTFYFSDAGGARTEVSFLSVKFDNAVPAVYIESPKPVAAFGSQITVSGQTLSGWSASVDGADIDVDRDGRFSTEIGAPSANALAIKLSHPRQGVHYYLRRHP